MVRKVCQDVSTNAQATYPSPPMPPPIAYNPPERIPAGLWRASEAIATIGGDSEPDCPPRGRGPWVYTMGQHSLGF